MKWLEGNRSLPDGAAQAVRIGIEGGRIVEVRAYGSADGDLPTLSPGFVDIHVHGGGGADTMDATEDAFARICATHARFGTTSLLLTTVTEAPEQVDAALRAARDFLGREPTGARAVGVHLEGPFLNPARAGAQRKDRMVDADPDLAAAWFATGVVRMITMAPERNGTHDVARLAHSRGILVAAGHTEASAADMGRAAQAGFSHVTHLCNAMRPLLHRDVGPIGHVVEDGAFTGDLICDGIHLDRAMVKTLMRAIGPERLMLITDAIRAAAVGAGEYDLGGQRVTVKDGACRLADGTLAGSILTMNRAWRLVQEFAGASRFAADAMAATNPAACIGLAKKGRLKEGYDADIAALDAGADVLWTMVGGRVVYERGGVS